MKRILSLILALVLILTLGGYAVTPPARKDNSGNTSSESKNSDDSNSLPDYFSKALGLISDYAEIVSVREKEGTKGIDAVLAKRWEYKRLA